MKIDLYDVDLLDTAAVDEIFSKHNNIYAVLHLAGLKAAKSFESPVLYYKSSLEVAFNLLNAMKKHGVTRMIFSCSSTVHGDPATNPIKEDSPLRPATPYAKTKYFLEEILADYARSLSRTKDQAQFRVIVLRYFNPIGAP